LSLTWPDGPSITWSDGASIRFILPAHFAHDPAGLQPSGTITPGHVRAFQAVTTGMYGEVTLWSCRINGEPGVAIVLAEHVGEGKIGVMPLFVAITPGMKVTFESEQGGEGGGDGPQREFRDARDITQPSFDPS
jgi:hypothetical protein